MAKEIRARAVTVVVPIYDHWSSLERCLESIFAYVDLSVHRVILINDCGPHADTIEALVLHAVAGRAGIEYYRNESNLGFVGACNRAVLNLDGSGNDILLLNSDAELTAGALDEMTTVLYSAEHHGVVCPRSDNATIASVPFFRRESAHAQGWSHDRSAEIFAEIAPLLPRFYVSPVSIGFCYLIKRSLIDNHGLFDPVFGVGYNEENDFCLRINALGYSSLIANHAFVRHLGSASFDSKLKSQLERKNYELLLARYPFYPEAVRSFISFGYSAVDVFAEVIATGSTRRTILVDLHHLSLVYNGSTRYALSFLRALANTSLSRDLELTIAAQPGAIEFFGLESYGIRTVAYSTLTGVFDVGIAIAPINSLDQLVQMNKHCVRWVVSHFDLIASRSLALLATDPLRSLVVELGLQHADRVISLSDFSLRDATAFFPHLAKNLESKTKAVMLGSTQNAVTGIDGDRLVETELRPAIARLITRGGYVVVMGNFYPHKQVAMAVGSLASAGVPILAFGPLPDVEETDATVVVSSGTLSETQLHRVLENAALVVFPSAYEGFGLPIADALDFGVPVVAFDTSVAREVVRKLRLGKAVRFFDRFSLLPSIVASALSDTVLHDAAALHRGSVRGLAPYNEALWRMALDQLDEPIDLASLEIRFSAIKQLERISTVQSQVVAGLRSELTAARSLTDAVISSRTHRAGRKIALMASPLLRITRQSNRL
ncbi:MAG: glycosyltransferase [Kineosporiaceae bacterium]|nr:glycosyltransferase [Aeromicrobium sp.]